MKSNCVDKRRNGDKQKTKTKTLIPILEDNQYERKPHQVIMENNKLVARAYIMGRFEMLHSGLKLYKIALIDAFIL